MMYVPPDIQRVIDALPSGDRDKMNVVLSAGEAVRSLVFELFNNHVPTPTIVAAAYKTIGRSFPVEQARDIVRYVLTIEDEIESLRNALIDTKVLHKAFIVELLTKLTMKERNALDLPK